MSKNKPVFVVQHDRHSTATETAAEWRRCTEHEAKERGTIRNAVLQFNLYIPLLSNGQLLFVLGTGIFVK